MILILKTKNEFSVSYLSFSDLKQSAQQILHDLDNRSIEDKVKRFLNNIINDQRQYGISSK